MYQQKEKQNDEIKILQLPILTYTQKYQNVVKLQTEYQNQILSNQIHENMFKKKNKNFLQPIQAHEVNDLQLGYNRQSGYVNFLQEKFEQLIKAIDNDNVKDMAARLSEAHLQAENLKSDIKYMSQQYNSQKDKLRMVQQYKKRYTQMQQLVNIYQQSVAQYKRRGIIEGLILEKIDDLEIECQRKYDSPNDIEIIEVLQSEDGCNDWQKTEKKLLLDRIEELEGKIKQFETEREKQIGKEKVEEFIKSVEEEEEKENYPALDELTKNYTSKINELQDRNLQLEEEIQYQKYTQQTVLDNIVGDTQKYYQNIMLQQSKNNEQMGKNYQKQISDCEAQRDALQVEIEQLQQQTDLQENQYNTKISVLTEKNKDLEAQLQLAKQTIRQQQEKMIQYEKRSIIQSNVNQMSRVDESTVQGHVVENDKMLFFNQEVEKLSQQLKQANTQNFEIKAQLAGKEAIIEQQRKQQNQYQGNLRQEKQEHYQLKEAVEVLNQIIQQKEQEGENMENQIQYFKTQIQSQGELIEKLKQAIVSKNENIQKMEQQDNIEEEVDVVKVNFHVSQQFQIIKQCRNVNTQSQKTEDQLQFTNSEYRQYASKYINEQGENNMISYLEQYVQQEKDTQEKDNNNNKFLSPKNSNSQIGAQQLSQKLLLSQFQQTSQYVQNSQKRILETCSKNIFNRYIEQVRGEEKGVQMTQLQLKEEGSQIQKESILQECQQKVEIKSPKMLSEGVQLSNLSVKKLIQDVKENEQQNQFTQVSKILDQQNFDYMPQQVQYNFKKKRNMCDENVGLDNIRLIIQQNKNTQQDQKQSSIYDQKQENIIVKSDIIYDNENQHKINILENVQDFKKQQKKQLQVQQGIQIEQSVQEEQIEQNVQEEQIEQNVQEEQIEQNVQGIQVQQGIQNVQEVQIVQQEQNVQVEQIVQQEQNVQIEQNIQGVQVQQGIQSVQEEQSVQNVQVEQIVQLEHNVQKEQGIQVGKCVQKEQGIQVEKGVQIVQEEQNVQDIQEEQSVQGVQQEQSQYSVQDVQQGDSVIELSNLYTVFNNYVFTNNYMNLVQEKEMLKKSEGIQDSRIIIGNILLRSSTDEKDDKKTLLVKSKIIEKQNKISKMQNDEIMQTSFQNNLAIEQQDNLILQQKEERELKQASMQIQQILENAKNTEKQLQEAETERGQQINKNVIKQLSTIIQQDKVKQRHNNVNNEKEESYKQMAVVVKKIMEDNNITLSQLQKQIHDNFGPQTGGSVKKEILKESTLVDKKMPIQQSNVQQSTYQNKKDKIQQSQSQIIESRMEGMKKNQTPSVRLTLKNIRTMLNKQRGSITNQVTQIQLLNQQLDVVRQEKQQLQEKNMELVKEVNYLQKKTIQLKREFNKDDRVREEFEKSVLKSKIRTKEDRIQKMKKDLEKLQKNFTNLKDILQQKKQMQQKQELFCEENNTEKGNGAHKQENDIDYKYYRQQETIQKLRKQLRKLLESEREGGNLEKEICNLQQQKLGYNELVVKYITVRRMLEKYENIIGGENQLNDSVPCEMSLVMQEGNDKMNQIKGYQRIMEEYYQNTKKGTQFDAGQQYTIQKMKVFTKLIQYAQGIIDDKKEELRKYGQQIKEKYKELQKREMGEGYEHQDILAQLDQYQQRIQKMVVNMCSGEEGAKEVDQDSQNGSEQSFQTSCVSKEEREEIVINRLKQLLEEKRRVVYDMAKNQNYLSDENCKLQQENSQLERQLQFSKLEVQSLTEILGQYKNDNLLYTQIQYEQLQHYRKFNQIDQNIVNTPLELLFVFEKLSQARCGSFSDDYAQPSQLSDNPNQAKMSEIENKNIDYQKLKEEYQELRKKGGEVQAQLQQSEKALKIKEELLKRLGEQLEEQSVQYQKQVEEYQIRALEAEKKSGEGIESIRQLQQLQRQVQILQVALENSDQEKTSLMSQIIDLQEQNYILQQSSQTELQTLIRDVKQEQEGKNQLLLLLREQTLDYQNMKKQNTQLKMDIQKYKYKYENSEGGEEQEKKETIILEKMAEHEMKKRELEEKIKQLNAQFSEKEMLVIELKEKLRVQNDLYEKAETKNVDISKKNNYVQESQKLLIEEQKQQIYSLNDILAYLKLKY